MQLIYFMSESLAPEKFARILNPADARYELERHYLFGGSSMSSISSRHTITRNTQSGIGVSSYREDSGMKRGVFDELKRGSLLAVDASIGAWSPVKYPFFIIAQGRLQRYPGSVLPPQYPVERIIQRYEEMISRYAARPKPTSLPRDKTPLKSAADAGGGRRRWLKPYRHQRGRSPNEQTGALAGEKISDWSGSEVSIRMRGLRRNAWRKITSRWKRPSWRRMSITRPIRWRLRLACRKDGGM